MMQISVSSLANIMQDIGTESIQLQTIMDGSVWLPHDTVLACPPLAIIIQDIVTDTKLLYAIKNGMEVIMSSLANIMQDIVTESIHKCIKRVDRLNPLKSGLI